MSLVSTYVRAVDGNFYRDPSLGDGVTWFVCFDDDDPEEVVVKLLPGETRPEVIARTERLLSEAGINATIEGCGRMGGSRSFGGKFAKAFSAWINIKSRIPIPRRGDPTTTPNITGVRYDWPA